MNGLLKREQRATRYQYHRVREFEEEIKLKKYSVMGETME